jgi:hypothetical protein
MWIINGEYYIVEGNQPLSIFPWRVESAAGFLTALRQNSLLIGSKFREGSTT